MFAVALFIGCFVILLGIVKATDLVEALWAGSRPTIAKPTKPIGNPDAILKDVITGAEYTVAENGMRVYVDHPIETVLNCVDYVEACRFKDRHGGRLQIGAPRDLWRWVTPC